MVERLEEVVFVRCAELKQVVLACQVLPVAAVLVA